MERGKGIGRAGRKRRRGETGNGDDVLDSLISLVATGLAGNSSCPSLYLSHFVEGAGPSHPPLHSSLSDYDNKLRQSSII